MLKHSLSRFTAEHHVARKHPLPAVNPNKRCAIREAWHSIEPDVPLEQAASANRWATSGGIVFG